LHNNNVEIELQILPLQGLFGKDIFFKQNVHEQIFIDIHNAAPKCFLRNNAHVKGLPQPRRPAQMPHLPST
jgi:hypothetical protein